MNPDNVARQALKEALCLLKKQQLEEPVPSRERALAITNLEQAMLWLMAEHYSSFVGDCEGDPDF